MWLLLVERPKYRSLHTRKGSGNNDQRPAIGMRTGNRMINLDKLKSSHISIKNILIY